MRKTPFLPNRTHPLHAYLTRLNSHTPFPKRNVKTCLGDNMTQQLFLPRNLPKGIGSFEDGCWPRPKTGEVRVCVKETCFLLLFCRQDVSQSLSSVYLSLSNSQFKLLGSSHGPLTAADLFGNVKEKSTSSLAAAPTVQNSICHDLYIARPSDTHGCECYCENEWVCLRSRPAYIHPSSLFPAQHSPPPNSHQTKSLHPDFLQESNPKKPFSPVRFPTSPPSK